MNHPRSAHVPGAKLSLAQTLRSIGVGRALYWGYHWPLEKLARSRREGGPLNQWITARSAAEMGAAATILPTLGASRPASREVHLLSGHNYWPQLLFCLFSLQQNCDLQILPIVHDDGTVSPQDRATFSRIFPQGKIIPNSEAQQRLAQYLPAEKFPMLNLQWKSYPHLRKITDPHLGASGWKLVMDSDLLFYRNPELMLNWLNAPDRPFHMLDVKTSYGYPTALLADVRGALVPERVNVGLIGLRSENIDWEQLEYWTATLLHRAGSSYYLEQALSALLVAGTNPAVAPAHDYITWPTPGEISRPTAIMHHYVDISKIGYFREAWRMIAAKKSPA